MKNLTLSFLTMLLIVSCKEPTGDPSSGVDQGFSSISKDDDRKNRAPQNGADLTPLQVKDLIHKNPDLIIVDVRTPGEFEAGSIEDAMNVDLYSPNFLMDIKKLDPDEMYLLYCTVGGRSAAASELIKNAGFTSVFNSEKGFESLKEEGIPVKE